MAYTGVYGGDNDPKHYPLLSSKFDINVHGRVVDARLNERYESHNTESLIHYVFFLPPEAALLNVTARIGQRPITIALKTVKEADRLFKKEARNQTAIKVEQIDFYTSMFQIALGHVRRGEIIDVAIAYSYLIATDIRKDSFRLDVPIGRGLFDPRTPGPHPTGKRTVFISPSAPVGGDVINIEVHLSMNDSIRNIDTPSHKARTNISLGSTGPLPPNKRLNNSQAFIQYASKTVTPKNFVLVWNVTGSDNPVCSVESHSGTIAFALNVASRFEFGDRPPQDFLFLVDCSGSMAGDRAKMAKHAVRHMLDKLPHSSSTFNIFRFTTTCTSVLPNGQRLRYDDDTKRTGKELVPGSDSRNSGGKDLYNAILTALRNRDPTAERTSIIIVTDGLDWSGGKAVQLIANEARIARRREKWVRLFVLGIGDEISREMCENLARTGAGTAIYIGQTDMLDNDHVKEKSETLMRSIGLAPLEIVRIDWPFIPAPEKNPSLSGDGLDFSKENDGLNDPDIGSRPKGENLPPPQLIQQSPARGKLFWALQSTWYAICRGTIIPGRTVVSVFVNVPLRGPRYKQVLKVPLLPVAPTSGNAIHSLQVAAHALIQDLEDQLPRIKNNPDKLYLTEAEISRLGLRYNVVSSQTTFVSRPKQETSQPIFLSLPESTEPPRQDGPEAPSDYDSEHGWNTVIHNRMMLEPGQQQLPTPMFLSQDDPSTDDSFPADLAHQTENVHISDGRSSSASVQSSSKTVGSNGDDGDPLKRFLGLQNTDGSFSSKITTYVFPSSAKPAIPAVLSVLSGPAAVKESIWITIIAIVHLEKKFAENQRRWDRAKINGLRFISSNLGTVVSLHGQNSRNVITRLRASAELYMD